MTNIKQLQDIASIIRRDLIENIDSTSKNDLLNNLSYAEILSCLFFSEIHLDIKNPENQDNDQFTLPKQKSNKLINIILKRLNAIKEESEENSWQKIKINNSDLNLSISAGFALSARLKNRKYRSYILLDENEMSKGTFYEAIQFASHNSLNNLCAILSINSANIKNYKQRFDSLGWNSLIIQGHDIKQILNSFKEVEKSEKPTIILAQTIKGKGVSFLENNPDQNKLILNDSNLVQALKDINYIKMPKISLKKPKRISVKEDKNKVQYSPKEYKVTDLVSTEESCKETIHLMHTSNKRIIALDSNKFFSQDNTLGLALGLSSKGFIPCIFSHESALSKNLSQIQSLHPIIIFGKNNSDIAYFRTLNNSHIFSPSDAISSGKLIKIAENLQNISYIKNSSTLASILYKYDEEFLIGGFKTLLSSSSDKAVIASSGNTVQEALKAHTLLKNSRIDSAVIDLYSIKPLNIYNLIEFIKAHGNLLVVVEENHSQGNIGEMLSNELINSDIKIIHLPIINNIHPDSNKILSSIRSFLESKPLESLIKDDSNIKKQKNKLKSKKKK